MKIIKAKAEILTPLEDQDVRKIYESIERAGRTCYKSNGTGDPGKFVKKIIENGHEAMIEHASLTVLFTVDRGVSHELVRHRLASFAQESTRYCNYSKDKFGNELTFIEPCFWNDGYPSNTWHMMNEWKRAMGVAEKQYFTLLNMGAKPEEARSVLPNSLKTEVVMTANLREWRHFLKLRAAGVTGKPHPQMLEVAVPLLNTLRNRMPEVFGDIELMREVTE